MKTIKLESKGSFLFSSTMGADGNCKVCYVDKLDGCLYFNIEETIRKIKELIEKHDKLGFFCTFNKYGYERSIPILDEHFYRAYTVSIPIGYGSPQYHIYYVHPNKTSGQRLSDEYIPELKRNKCKLL